MSKNRVTISDVAREVGVSPATVSNVMNRRLDRVSPKTAQKVLDTLEELGYHREARRHAPKKKLGKLALVTNDMVYFAPTISGAEAAAYRFGFRLVLCKDQTSTDQQDQLIEELLEVGVQGLILLAYSDYRELLTLKQAADHGIPVVLVNHLTEADSALNVLMDNEGGTFRAVHHLIELGHRDIGYIHTPIQGPLARTAAVERMRGFREALREYDVPLVREWIHPAGFGDAAGLDMGYWNAKSILSGRSRPTAMLCGTDYIAFGVMKAAVELGLHIPDDLSLIGHDDTQAARYTSPPLTSIRQPLYTAGERAAEALVKFLWKEAELQGSLRLPCDLIIRASTRSRLGTKLGMAT